MGKFTVLAVKNVVLETSIDAENQEEAWAIAQNMNKTQFQEVADEHAWRIKTIYQDNEAVSV